jgi:biotin carboxyl carrier protein
VAEGDRLHLKLGTRTYSVSVEDPVAAAAHDGGDNDEIRADMPGVVVALRCQVGEEVEAGQPLLTLESMKMQITINAHRSGVVAAIHAGVNEPFQKGALLLALHAEQETSAP